MLEAGKPEEPSPVSKEDADLLAFLSRIESENPQVVAAALSSEVDNLLGRATSVSSTNRGFNRESRRRPPSTAFAWYKSIADKLPPMLEPHETIEAAKAVEIGLFAQERLDSDELITRQLRRDLRMLEREGGRAFELLTLSNLRLVFHWSKGAATSIGGDWVQDAFQAGCIGLMRGLQGWDYMKGYQLSTFVSWHIRQQIQRWRMNETAIIRVPVHVWEKLDSNSGESSTNAIIDAARQALNVSYLDELTDEEREALSRNSAFEDRVVALDREEAVAALLATLDPRAAGVIRLRNGLGADGKDMTLEAIGAIYGVTRERIRQIEKQSMEVLATYARDCGFDQLL